MVKRAPGRTRPVDVDVSPFLPSFIEQLIRVTRGGEEACCLIGDNSVIPGSPKGTRCADNPGEFAVDYLFQEILSKYDDGKPSKEKEAKTWDRFKEAEEMCAATNTRLHDGSSGFSTSPFGAISLIERARRKISACLPVFSWDAAAQGFAFTSGASVRLKRKNGDAVYKFSSIPEVTHNNLDLASCAIWSCPLWEERLRWQGESGLEYCNIVIGNRVDTVPKNYKTNRVIAIEPTMNMYVQKGISAIIRKSLRKVGIDIRSQRFNQDMALLGSVTDGYATIDLSMASDTVSLELVRSLLPPDWVAALEQCRSSIGVLASGEQVLYRKFSSMGNGYTFELETLIFWGLATAVAEAYGVSGRLIAVYGDDIVVPAAIASPLIELLAFCGFKTNDDKTFVDGGFRESCGKHYLHGLDVSPFYIKEDVTSLTKLFHLHNQLYRWQKQNQWNNHIDHDGITLLLASLRQKAPSNWRRPRIPDGMGDGAFIGTFDQCLPSTPVARTKSKDGSLRTGWEGWQVKVIAEVTGATRPGDEHWKSVLDLGYYLRSLSYRGLDDPFGFEESVGGLSLAPKVRVIDLIVRQY